MFFVFSIICFFFKQKTAYEMRISDWSSDVCSSDLRQALGAKQCLGGGHFASALLQFRVAGVRPPLLPDLLQPRRVDGQGKQFVAIWAQAGRQFHSMQVVVGERIFGRTKDRKGVV